VAATLEDAAALLARAGFYVMPRAELIARLGLNNPPWMPPWTPGKKEGGP
jgi:hypothetical protein